MKVLAMLGYKLFKELDDGSIDLIRIIKIRKNHAQSDPSEITIRHEYTGEVETVRVDSISGEYTPLEPDGYATFNIVNVNSNTDNTLHKDVIVTVSKFLNMKIGDRMPYAVCRQSITDIFNNLVVQNENDMLVGLSVNQDTCPANFDFRIMLACTEIIYSDLVNFYRSDTVEDLYEFIKIKKFNDVLEELFKEHVKSTGDNTLLFKLEHGGWCKDLKTLIKQNNFQSDIDQMLGITYINPVIEDHFVTKTLPNGEEYTSFDNDMAGWLSSIYKLAFNDITVLKYDHDINLAEFNNARYFLLRDNTKNLYLVVYTLDGEYHESDLLEKYGKTDFSDEFRINFYNKYNFNK